MDGSGSGNGGGSGSGGASDTLSVSSGSVSPIQQGIAKIVEFGDRIQTFIDAHLAFFGNDKWLEVEDETAFGSWFASFSNLIQGSTAAEAKITAEERIQLLTVPVPAPLTGSDVNQFIDRWNRTVEYWDSGIFNSFDVQDGQSQDFLAIDNLKKVNTALVNAIEKTEAEGYVDFIDGVTKTAQELQKAFEGNGGGVCATVKIRIDQDAIMTRSAFLGELEIDNGNLSSLENISVVLQVKDSQGNIVNDLFGITDPLLKNITSVNGTGILTTDDPNTPQDEGVGSAKWTFIPTNLAAPEVPTEYSIGGTLSYTENGQVITVPLLSTPVTVYPQAELYLDYFQERNVYGDDPFTDPIETSVPFSLGVLVRNEGKGEAKNLQITSGKPKIIENEKGLLIDFQIIGSEVNGQGKTPSLTANFGNIGAGETAVADWLFKSSLQGKFIEYSATFEHVNGLGKPELSLLKETKIHELTRKVRVNNPTDDGLPDFLVNDVFDANFAPDTLYFSNGGTAPVNVNTTATADGPASLNDLTVQVTATTEAGWSYLRLDDPADGLFQIKSVLRADGTELLLDNVWRTDRTFPATGRPIYEDILHVLDFAATAGPQTYTVVYTTGDQTPPKVQDIVDVAPDPRTTAVNTIDVVFTEVIQSDTFDISDLTLTRNGGPNLITSGVTLTQIDTATYRIGNLSGLTGNAGEYQLSINASGVKDLEGLSGTGTVTEGWVFTGDGPAITAVTGLPSTLLKAPIDTLDVAFTEAIDPTSFDFNDILLNRDGGGNLVNNTITITQLSGLTYRIGNLSGLTSVDGSYTLLVNANTIADTDGNQGTGSKGLTWSLDTNAPRLTSITDVTSPRNTKVSSLDITFSKAIDPASFDLSDLVLTRNGSTNLLTSSATLTQLTPTSYRLGGLTGLQAIDGTYTLGVVGSGIQDTATNAVANTLSETWTLDTVAPLAPINLQVNGNAAIVGSNQFKTNATTVQVTGALGESGLRVFIRDKALNQILGQATVTGTSFESTVQLTGPGARELELQVVDAAGNATTTPLSLFADVTAPAVVEFLGVPQAPTTTALNTIDIRFSEELNPATFDLSDLILTRDGGSNLITSATTLELISCTTYRLSGLADLTNTPGAYTLTVNTPSIQDLAGNAGLETKSALFTIQAPPTPGVIFAQSNGSTAVTEGGTTDTYTAVLKTQPTADVTLTLAVGDQLTTDQTTLTFTPTNWNIPQTIAVSALNDTTPEGAHSSTISHTIASPDPSYSGLSLPILSVAIVDNDNAPAKFHTDFNSDGFSDLIWRNPTTGQNYLWFLNNGTPVASTKLLPDVYDPSWKIEGTGDFDGDGLEDDLAWRNHATGQNSIWFTDLTTNGAEVVGGAALPAVPDPAWKLQGVGDFDHDSFQDDLIWFNPGSEDLTVWFLQNGQPTGSTEINVGSPIGSGWEIAGVGTFDGGTHQDDLLWRNALTSETRVWFMEGTQPTGSAAISPQVLDANWRIEGVADFNGDTVASDILWRNYATGTTTLWFMNGTTLAGGVGDIQPALDPSFVAVV